MFCLRCSTRGLFAASVPHSYVFEVHVHSKYIPLRCVPSSMSVFVLLPKSPQAPSRHKPCSIYKWHVSLSTHLYCLNTPALSTHPKDTVTQITCTEFNTPTLSTHPTNTVTQITHTLYAPNIHKHCSAFSLIRIHLFQVKTHIQLIDSHKKHVKGKYIKQGVDKN